MSLYHAEVGYPEFVKEFIHNISDITLQLTHDMYGEHAISEAGNDRYDEEIVLPSSVCFADCYIFEVGTSSKNEIVKIVLRTEYDDVYDISMAMSLVKGRVFVKTVWLNDREDTHCTLDESKYDRPKV